MWDDESFGFYQPAMVKIRDVSSSLIAELEKAPEILSSRDEEVHAIVAELPELQYVASQLKLSELALSLGMVTAVGTVMMMAPSAGIILLRLSVNL